MEAAEAGCVDRRRRRRRRRATVEAGIFRIVYDHEVSPDPRPDLRGNLRVSQKAK